MRITKYLLMISLIIATFNLIFCGNNDQQSLSDGERLPSVELDLGVPIIGEFDQSTNIEESYPAIRYDITIEKCGVYQIDAVRLNNKMDLKLELYEVQEQSGSLIKLHQDTNSGDSNPRIKKSLSPGNYMIKVINQETIREDNTALFFTFSIFEFNVPEQLPENAAAPYIVNQEPLSENDYTEGSLISNPLDQNGHEYADFLVEINNPGTYKFLVESKTERMQYVIQVLSQDAKLRYKWGNRNSVSNYGDFNWEMKLCPGNYLVRIMTNASQPPSGEKKFALSVNSNITR